MPLLRAVRRRAAHLAGVALAELVERRRGLVVVEGVERPVGEQGDHLVGVLDAQRLEQQACRLERRRRHRGQVLGRDRLVISCGFFSRPTMPFQARLTTCATTSSFLGLRTSSHH